MPPEVSVVMSVYNGERYLREAVDSILNQTFTDFEFIIIDDGSIDRTWEILAGYNDPRIHLARNDGNIGLGKSLNKGLALANGCYIARMDADDVSLRERLAKQVSYMNAHPTCDVVATKIALIDHNGNQAGYWPVDMECGSSSEIRKVLPRTNCIAHPSVLARAPAVKEYGYNEDQRDSQDYELWLRLCSDGKAIEKIDEILLYHRIHSLSVTSKSLSFGSKRKRMKTKAVFLRNRVARLRLNWFDILVFVYLLKDVALFGAHVIRNVTGSILDRIRGSFTCPVRLLTSRKAHLRIFFFFPFYHVGGGEKVHAEIVHSVADRKPWVLFTKKSKDQKFKFLFQKSGVRLFDISLFTTVPLLSHIFARLLAMVINQCPKAVVFGANSRFYYRLIPFLRSDIRRIDLIHSFGGAMENVSLPFVSHIDNRVVVNRRTLSQIKEQYAAHNISQELIGRIILIENEVFVPNAYPDKRENGVLKVLYVGRGSPEKRVHLIHRAAQRCQEIGLPVGFTFVGDVSKVINAKDQNRFAIRGEIADADQLNELYGEADVLVLTSSREGFPLVIMEAMAHGVVPVTTDVGGISTHIKHKNNGILITDVDESAIVDSLVNILRELSSNRFLLKTLSFAAYEYARKHFIPSKLFAAYQQLILGSERINAAHDV